MPQGPQRIEGKGARGSPQFLVIGFALIQHPPQKRHDGLTLLHGPIGVKRVST